MKAPAAEYGHERPGGNRDGDELPLGRVGKRPGGSFEQPVVRRVGAERGR
jgi:hypothetical protein